MPSSRNSKLVRVALAAAVTLSGAVATTAVTVVTATTAQAASSVGGQIARSEVLSRAKSWVDAEVPYSQDNYHTDGSGTYYRQDCSGFVSMAWHINTSGTNSGFTTNGAVNYSTRLAGLDSLKPGDTLNNISAHMVLFVGWTDSSRTAATIYEEPNSTSHARSRVMTRAEMTSGGFLPYRYNNIVDDPTTANTVHLVDVTPGGGVYNAEGNFSAGQWSGWSDMGAAGIREVASASTGSTLRVFAVGSDNRIYEKDGNYGTGQWSAGWFQLQGAPTVTAISASSYGNTVHLSAIGTDGQMYNSDGDYAAGSWNGWTAHGGTNLKRIASASTSDNVNHIFVLDSADQLREIDANYGAGQWGSWGPAAGGFTGKDVTASAFGRTVHLAAIGNDGQLYNTDGDFAAGSWNGWSNKGGSGLKRLASATSGAVNVNHIFAVNGSNRLTEIDADYTAGTWSAWAEPAGGADSIAVTAAFTN